MDFTYLKKTISCNYSIEIFLVKQYIYIVYNKRIELEEGDYYLNEQGYKVFTEQFHLRRGYCCKSGCKHCPYGYDKKTDTFK